MKKLLTTIVILACFLTLIGWKNIASTQAIQVTTSLATQRTISESILSSGNLIYDNQVQIRSEIIGVISEVLVKEGDLVKEGQVLLMLDPTSFKANVADQQASVNAQQLEIELLQEEHKELVRQLSLSKTLMHQSALSENDTLKLQSKANIAAIKIKSAKERLNQKKALLVYSQAQLEKTLFKAPISGLIAQVDVKVGEAVIAGTTNVVGSSLMTLTDPQSAIVRLKVDEADIAQVYVGQRVEVFTSANPKTAIYGSVSKIGMSAQKETTSHGLFFYVDANLGEIDKIHPGMSCRADIIIKHTEPSITVPISAIQSQSDTEYVWVIAGDKAKKQWVTTGLANDTEQVIASGLSINDRVIVGNARTIKNLTENTVLTYSDVAL